MSSTEYAELAGLKITLSNLNIVHVAYQDAEWATVTNWLKSRIKELESMK
jgi:hypothetical protein